jgi:hypothetical protein
MQYIWVFLCSLVSFSSIYADGLTLQDRKNLEGLARESAQELFEGAVTTSDQSVRYTTMMQMLREFNKRAESNKEKALIHSAQKNVEEQYRVIVQGGASQASSGVGGKSAAGLSEDERSSLNRLIQGDAATILREPESESEADARKNALIKRVQELSPNCLSSEDKQLIERARKRILDAFDEWKRAQKQVINLSADERESLNMLLKSGTAAILRDPESEADAIVRKNFLLKRLQEFNPTSLSAEDAQLVEKVRNKILEAFDIWKRANETSKNVMQKSFVRIDDILRSFFDVIKLKPSPQKINVAGGELRKGLTTLLKESPEFATEENIKKYGNYIGMAIKSMIESLKVDKRTAKFMYAQFHPDKLADIAEDYINQIFADVAKVIRSHSIFERPEQAQEPESHAGPQKQEEPKAQDEYAQLASIKRTGEASDKQFLSKLKDILRNFPEDQRLYFSQDEKGKRASDMIWNAVKIIGDYFGLELVSFSGGKSARTKMTAQEVFDKRISMISFDIPKDKRTKSDIEMSHFKAATWLTQANGDEGSGPREVATFLSFDLEKSLTKPGRIEQSKVSASDKKALKQITDIYKIHLMPYKNDLPIVLFMFIAELMKHGVLYNNTFDFKFCIRCPEQNDENVLPALVIYAASGKDAAQKVLNDVYKMFNYIDIKGTGITPRFNAKVTDLIFWSQGHGDDKKQSRYKHWYAQDLITYRPDITGEKIDYYLKNPSGFRNK